MSAKSEKQSPPNLLRERRQELGLPVALPPWRSSRFLLLRGSLVGAVGLLIAMVSLLPLHWIESRQQRQLQALEPVEQQLQALEARLSAGRRRADALRKDNLKIAETWWLFLPSLLLEQLRRVTPVGVQLEEVSVQGDRIQISGTVAAGGTPGPLERINALVLNLGALPISQPGGVDVVKVIRDDDQPSVSFSLDWDLDAQRRPSIQQLQRLETSGLVQRYPCWNASGFMTNLSPDRPTWRAQITRERVLRQP